MDVYGLGNFPHILVQCWRYQCNRWTQISTPTLNLGRGNFFQHLRHLSWRDKTRWQHVIMSLTLKDNKIGWTTWIYVFTHSIKQTFNCWRYVLFSVTSSLFPVTKVGKFLLWLSKTVQGISSPSSLCERHLYCWHHCHLQNSDTYVVFFSFLRILQHCRHLSRLRLSVSGWLIFTTGSEKAFHQHWKGNNTVYKII